jgi:L-threonylcarbamoyladenylate synthase
LATIYHIDKPDDLQAAVEALRAGGLVAFPTETVYGLGALSTDEEAVRAVFRAKGRPAANPLILHIADPADLDRCAASLPPLAQKLVGRFWPGPLTLVVPKADWVPDVVSGGRATVGVRLPDDDIARRLIRAVGTPLVGPSANKSGRPSPTSVRHVLDDLEADIAGVVDGGTTPLGLESTLLDITATPPRVLRLGAVSTDQLEAVIGPVEVAPQAAPAGKLAHYQTRAKVWRLSGQDRAARALTWLQAAPRPAGLMLADETIAGLGPIPADVFVWNMGSLGRPEMAAHRLFEGLRRLDAAGCAAILTESWPRQGLGQALMNHLDLISQPLEEDAP